MVDSGKVKNILLRQMAEAERTGMQIQGGEAKIAALSAKLLKDPEETKMLVSAETATILKGWHASKRKQAFNVHELYRQMAAHQEQWGVPEEMLDLLWAFDMTLGQLVPDCETPSASGNDISLRNAVLRLAVRYSLRNVKYWVLERYVAGVISLNEVNWLGFFVESDQIIPRERRGATEELAEVTVRNIGMDCVSIRVATPVGETQNRIGHYWPKGVKFALIRIMNENGKVFIERITSRKHNRFEISSEYRGQRLLAKAAYLVHTDDVPTFSPDDVVFSTPYSYEDIIRH